MKNTEASSTAKVIAAATILLHSEKREVSDAATWCAEFLSSTRRDRLLAWSSKNPITRKCWRLIEKFTLPGIIEHYAWRKHWIEKLCRQAIADGCDQVVVLGAGFDTLALRLAQEFSHIAFIELDHPATSQAKWRALKQRNHQLPTNLKTYAVNLTTEPLPHELIGAKFSFWIIEGVLMYLEASAVDRLLGELATSTTRRQVVFTHMRSWSPAASGFRPKSRLIEAWLAWRGEPFRWSIAPEEIEQFLHERGYHLLQMIDPSDEGRRLCGENLVLCEARLWFTALTM
jgi:methyltransferase (TIGR00027 family)